MKRKKYIFVSYSRDSLRVLVFSFQLSPKVQSPSPKLLKKIPATDNTSIQSPELFQIQYICSIYEKMSAISVLELYPT